MEQQIKDILRSFGENPERQGLIDTPKRMINMWKETMRGYDPKQKPKVTVFNNGQDGLIYDQMIIDSGTFYSNCEHHFMPFFGQYWFCYIPHPQGKILGLSKVARVVDYFSAKLQIQERLGSEIVDYLEESIDGEYSPLGIGIIIKGEHLCKTMRGVKKQGQMTTAYLRGALKTDVKAREEFLSYIK